MKPGQHTFTVRKKRTFKTTMTYKDKTTDQPIDLSGCDVRIHVRKSKGDTETVTELTVADGQIVLGGPAGTIKLELDPTQTDALAAGRYTYDLELTGSGGAIDTLMYGGFIVEEEITR